jgi:putative SOS response-associated peptidase YedK
MRDTTGNLPPMPGIFPDYTAPVVRNAPDGVRELTKARWGMPSSQFGLMQAAQKRAAKLETNGKAVDFKELLRMEPDSGTTNIRNFVVTTRASYFILRGRLSTDNRQRPALIELSAVGVSFGIVFIRLLLWFLLKHPT